MDGVLFDLDAARLTAEADKLTRRYLAAGTRAIGGTTKDLERKLEAATQAGVPGRLWRAWKSDSFPRSGPAKDPVGRVYLNGGARTQGALAFWSKPGEVRGKRGQWLAIPLPAAGPRGRDRMLTPGEWERTHGTKLRFVFRAGKPGLLVADDAVLSGRSRVARPNTERRRAAGRGNTTVPIFVLVPLVKHRNTVAVATIVTASEGELTKQFFEEVRALSRG